MEEPPGSLRSALHVKREPQLVYCNYLSVAWWLLAEILPASEGQTKTQKLQVKGRRGGKVCFVTRKLNSNINRVKIFKQPPKGEDQKVNKIFTLLSIALVNRDRYAREPNNSANVSSNAFSQLT